MTRDEALDAVLAEYDDNPLVPWEDDRASAAEKVAALSDAYQKAKRQIAVMELDINAGHHDCTDYEEEIERLRNTIRVMKDLAKRRREVSEGYAVATMALCRIVSNCRLEPLEGEDEL